ncbi:MAG: autoinducer binding domain-containing protein, partial [Bacteroidota bacterium]
FLIILLPPISTPFSTLFPYTTLFLSIFDTDCVTATLERFHSIVCEYGFTDYYYARTNRLGASDGNSSLEEYRVWDPDWLEIYEAQRLTRNDFVRNSVDSGSRLIKFRGPGRPLSKNEFEFRKLAESYNRLNGLALPIWGNRGVEAGFSVTGASKEPSQEQTAVFLAAAMPTHFQITALSMIDVASQYDLKLRELQLLRLLVSGRSMVQIAVYLDTSEQWIRKSFLQMRRKLGVQSNEELVYRALKNGLIQ